MFETFVQVWFLCAIAFVAGSGVTWLLFVHRRPRHSAHPLFRPAPPRIHHRATGLPRLERTTPPEPPPPPAEPALANLDTHGSDAAERRPGSSAAGALDRLGVAGGAHLRKRPPAVEIPAQGSPVDGPGPNQSR